MEQLPFIAKPEIYNIPFSLSTEIEKVDLTWTEPGTICYFYSPEIKLKKRKSNKIKAARKKSKKSEIHYHPKYAEPSLVSY